jgi:hypothetical protein
LFSIRGLRDIFLTAKFGAEVVMVERENKHDVDQSLFPDSGAWGGSFPRLPLKLVMPEAINDCRLSISKKSRFKQNWGAVVDCNGKIYIA